MIKITHILIICALIFGGISNASANDFKYPVGTAFNTQFGVYIITGTQGGSYELTSLNGNWVLDKAQVEAWAPIEETLFQELYRELNLKRLSQGSLVGDITMPDYFGDANSDGQITIVDGLLIAQYVAGQRKDCASGEASPKGLDCMNSYQIVASDVDNNGIVENKDAVWIAENVVNNVVPKEVSERFNTRITVIPEEKKIIGTVTKQYGAAGTPVPYPDTSDAHKNTITVTPSVLALGSRTPLTVRVWPDANYLIRVSSPYAETVLMQTDNMGYMQIYPNPNWNIIGSIQLDLVMGNISKIINVEEMAIPATSPEITGITVTLDKTAIQLMPGSTAVIYATVKDSNGNPLQDAFVNGERTNYGGRVAIEVSAPYTAAKGTSTKKAQATYKTFEASASYSLEIVTSPEYTPVYTPAPTASPGSTPYPAPTTGVISAFSSPSGAKVVIDGKDAGTTTEKDWIKTKVSPGPHIVKFIKTGYVESTSSVNTIAGQDIPIQAYLIPIPENPAQLQGTETATPAPTLNPNGYILAWSEPSGAALRIDDVLIGLTTSKYVIAEVIPGQHILSITKQGYEPYSATIITKTGGVDKISVYLEDLNPQAGNAAATPIITPPPTPEIMAKYTGTGQEGNGDGNSNILIYAGIGAIIIGILIYKTKK